MKTSYELRDHDDLQDLRVQRELGESAMRLGDVTERTCPCPYCGKQYAWEQMFKHGRGVCVPPDSKLSAEQRKAVKHAVGHDA